MNEFTRAIQRHLRMSWLMFALFAALQLKPAGAVKLDLTYPADCPVSAQACIDQICAAGGGTLHIEPGTHQFGPSILQGVTAPNNLLALCSNVKIVGAGTDPTTGTTIDCSNSNVPLLGFPPCLATGGTPFSSQTEQNIEVAGIRFACPSNESNCAPTALIAIRGK